MTAPDAELVELLAAALYAAIAKAAPSGSVTVEDMTASLLPVVEQHTNRRTAELEAHAEYMGRELPIVAARIAELQATINRVERALAEGPLHRLDFPRSKDPYGIERQTIRKALDGGGDGCVAERG